MNLCALLNLLPYYEWNLSASGLTNDLGFKPKGSIIARRLIVSLMIKIYYHLSWL